jgi:hypothetical protein
LGGLGALILLVAAAVLGYVAVVAARRSEGVFVPVVYVALVCLAGGALLASMVWSGGAESFPTLKTSRLSHP